MNWVFYEFLAGLPTETAVVVEMQPDKEECYNLAPVVKYLLSEADLLNAFFIDHEKDIENFKRRLNYC